jgi:hypothetical protein
MQPAMVAIPLCETSAQLPGQRVKARTEFPKEMGGSNFPLGPEEMTSAAPLGQLSDANHFLSPKNHLLPPPEPC